MDKRVFLISVLIILIAGSIIGYNVLSGSCEPFEIKMEPESPRVGDIVKFTSMSDDPDEISWDFGDGQKATGAEATHKYDVERKYIVSATITEKCFSTKEVYLLPKREMTTVSPVVTIPSNIKTGDFITFQDMTGEASKWIWKVIESGASGNEKLFSTTFDKPGKYNLILSVSGDYISGTDTFEINVTKASLAESKSQSPKTSVNKKPEIIKEPEIIPEVAPKASKGNYQDSESFARNFVRIATAIGSDEENASNEWKEIIVSQTGDKGSLKILLTDGQSEPKEMTLESFKTKQIILSEPYIVKQVKDIKRRPDNSISQITVIVTKN